MDKLYIDIFPHYCPDCRKMTMNIAYLQHETAVAVVVRFICLAMDCNYSYEERFLKPNKSLEGGDKNEKRNP